MMALEYERKFLVRKETTFWTLIQELARPHKHFPFRAGKGYTKDRLYRYFDTFEGSLRKSRAGFEFYASGEREAQELLHPGPGILEGHGASLSARGRWELSDTVLTAKIPVGENEREELDFSLGGASVFSIQPDHFLYLSHLDAIRKRISGKPLQEAVRVYVRTHRYKLYKGRRTAGNEKMEVALDQVIALHPLGGQVSFFELEIERTGGTKRDVNKLATAYLNRHGRALRESPLPKWIKAGRLLRGDKI
jgi:hypothetical protein